MSKEILDFSWNLLNDIHHDAREQSEFMLQSAVEQIEKRAYKAHQTLIVLEKSGHSLEQKKENSDFAEDAQIHNNDSAQKSSEETTIITRPRRDTSIPHIQKGRGLDFARLDGEPTQILAKKK